MSQNSSRLRNIVLLSLIALLGAPLHQAASSPKGEQFPIKAVELINPFGAGGAADVQARKLAEIVSKHLGQPLIVRNVTGAGGAIAYNEVYRAKPTGYTLIWYSGAINTLANSGQIPINYTAFETVCGVGQETVAIAVKNDAPWKDFKELIAYAKQNPGKVSVGNSGIGSVTHMVPVAIANKASVQFTHVPFGTGLALAALLGGKISASSQHPAEILPQVKAGEVRVLVITAARRIDLWPNVPTAKEIGVDVVYEQWRGVAAPKSTPKPVVDKLATAFKKSVESPEWIEFAKSVGTTPQYRDPETMSKFVGEMDKITSEIMTTAGLKK